MNQFVCTTVLDEVRARLLLGTLYPECKTTKVFHDQIQAQLEQNKALNLLPSTTTIDEFVKLCGLKEATEKRVIPTFFSKLQTKIKRKALPRKSGPKKKQQKTIETIIISSDSEDDSDVQKEIQRSPYIIDETKSPKDFTDELLMMDRPIDSETEEW